MKFTTGASDSIDGTSLVNSDKNRLCQVFFDFIATVSKIGLEDVPPTDPNWPGEKSNLPSTMRVEVQHLYTGGTSKFSWNCHYLSA